MEKMKNIYCWHYLKDWMEAQKMGIIHVIEAEQKGDGMFRWEQLIHMIHEDCFPQCFLCFRQCNENYLMLTKEQKKVFDFIKNEVLLQEKKGEQHLFSDFPAEFRSKILNAQVDSIWIRLDDNRNYI